MVTFTKNKALEEIAGSNLPGGSVMSPFASAYEPLAVTGLVRRAPEDFVVEEVLGFEPNGDGEHRWLQIRKRGITTHEVARALARHASVPQPEIGFSGLKDRNAVTMQWFSVPTQGSREPDWGMLNTESLRILRSVRNRRKLRRGSHRGNRFCVVIRALLGPDTLLQQRLAQIQRRGVPNYFGEQRFGRQGNNLFRAEQLFAGRPVRSRVKRGLYLSAARSWIFNHALSRRVEAGTWDQLQPGDLAMLDGTRSVFTVKAVDPALQERLERGDVHPSGPLPGAGETGVEREVRVLEAAVMAQFPTWCAGLVDAGLRHERRSLRLHAHALRWARTEAGTLTLEFSLQRGQFATAVLRECGHFVS